MIGHDVPIPNGVSTISLQDKSSSGRAKPRAVLVVVVSLVVAVSFRYLIAVAGDYGPRDLERFERLSGLDLPNWYGTMPFLMTWSRGDGQVFVVLAADPLVRNEAIAVLDVDYRLQRIGYSIAASALVLGVDHLLPLGLLTVNLASVVVIASVITRMASRDRRYLWLLANPSVLIGVASDTAEPLGIALLLAGICSTGASAALLGAALGLTRPDFGLGFGYARRRALTIGAWVMAAILVVAVVTLAGKATGFGAQNLSFPLTGFFDVWPKQDLGGKVILTGVLVAGISALFFGFRLSGIPRLALLASAVITLSYGSPVLDNVLNLIRVMGGTFVLWTLAAIQTEQST